MIYRGLTEWQFNKLAGPGFTVPRFLFVICVPVDYQCYAEPMTEGVMLRHLGYFVSFSMEEPVVDPDRRRTKPVRVPTTNVLTAAPAHRDAVGLVGVRWRFL